MTRTLLILMFIAADAMAHEWYPSSCCGNYDCKPVLCEDLAEKNDGSWLYLPTGNVFASGQVQQSQDNRCHVCLGKTDSRSLCAFIVSGA